ncbi:hypothetical protein FRC10_004350, partial [Ceratobasidium sp. 414]
MFPTKLILFGLASLCVAGAVPANLAPREDWKISLGWDGKVTTPAEAGVKPGP